MQGIKIHVAFKEVFLKLTCLFWHLFDFRLTFLFSQRKTVFEYDSICSFLSTLKKFVFKNFLDTESFCVFRWLCFIDWYDGHWCGSTYMVVRLSDIRSKTGPNWCQTVQYLLSHLILFDLKKQKKGHTESIREWRKIWAFELILTFVLIIVPN